MQEMKKNNANSKTAKKAEANQSPFNKKLKQWLVVLSCNKKT